MPKKGVLLINLGSPASTKTSDVRRYLKQFLWDKRVVNLPRSLWWLVLHFLVLPFRPRKSAKAYRKIWQPQGSPLILFTHALAKKLETLVDDKKVIVDYAMRYGKPSIKKKLTQFKQSECDEIIIIPLYPQYSSTTTASVYDEVSSLLQTWRSIPSLRFISHYYRHPTYIKAIAQSIQKAWKYQRSDLLLISFHGLPKKLTELGEPYFDQCHASAQLIAEYLNLKDFEWKLVFQSRFGKAEWLQPYCIEVLKKLPSQGIKNIDVICPGFATDCLETLEEIAITNQEIFTDAGGGGYYYIPALNDSDTHAELMLDLIHNAKSHSDAEA
ncbi:MAG: ferrochelatase [Methylococcales bacterium]|nr:ferrochelatase [Methylococcales bacterium]